MKMSKILMTGAVLALTSTSAYAATQGALAGTSVGTTNVRVEVLELVQINGLTDLNLDNGDGSNILKPNGGDVSATTTFCVHYNNGTRVSLLVESANGTGSYVLSDGTTNTLDYQVEVDEGDNGGATPHAEGAAVVYANMGSTTLDCGGTPNNSLRAFIVDPAAPLGVPNGTYTDTLTLTVTPAP